METAPEQVTYRNPVKGAGWAQVYHAITLDDRISNGAYRLLMLYEMHAQQKDACWPGRTRLAEMLKCSERSVTRYNSELEESGYITRQRRMSTSSITYIEDYEQIPYLRQIAQGQLSKRATHVPTHVTPMSHVTGHQCHVKKEQEKNEQENFTPPSGEKLPETETDELFGPAQETPPKTAEQYKKELQTVAGTDPLSGMLKTKETASAKSWTVPGVAGGADDWERVADAFCCLQGIRASDIPPKKQSQWARKLQSIGEEAQATPGQVIAAIRILPDTELAFKVPGYTSPFKQSFGDDIAMTIAKMATGQLGGTAPSSCDALAKAGYDVEALKRYAQERAAN